MATWTGIRDLETLSDFTTDGIVITQVSAAQAGDGTTNTTLRLGAIATGKLRVLRMNNPIATTVNPDGTPCIDFMDTLIVKTTGNRCFNRVTANTTPVMRWRRCAMSYTAGGGFLFMGNDNRVQTIFDDVFFTFNNYNFGFFGRNAIWNNVVICGGGNIGDTFPPNLPLEIKGLKLFDHRAMKLEHGSGGMYTVEMLNTEGVTTASQFFYWGANASTTSDQTDRCMHLVDSPFEADKFTATQNGAMAAWRTLKATYRTADGAGVPGAALYTAYRENGQWIDYRLSKTRNMGVNASKFYEPFATADQDPALPTAQTLRWLYILQPQDRVRISGFTDPENNIDTVVVGQFNNTTGKHYATADRMIVQDSSDLVPEGSALVTITRLEPLSSQTGAFTETRLEIGSARSLGVHGSNAPSTLYTLANYQSGAQVGVPGQTFKRESWETYIVPPYPYKRTALEWNIPQSAPSLGAKVEWNVLAELDQDITETDVATVLAYTDLDTTAKAYDYKEAWKRIEVNTLIGGVRENLFTKQGANLDFGSLNVVIDRTAEAPLTFDATTKTVTLRADTFVANMATTGTVTLQNGATVDGTVEDANGVRVVVRKSGGGTFNIAARRGTAGTYTDLGYQAGVTEVSYTVPKGTPVEVIMWSLGCVTYGRTISTNAGGVVLEAEMLVNTSINTTLDVSAYLPNIALSLDTSGANPVFVITFNAAMTISGIELGKAVVHRLVGQQVALQSGFPPGSTSTIVINADEITNQLPAARLALGASLSATDRVYLDFFINTAPAVAINPAYVINPPREDGNQVIILRAKPALDASVMAFAVRQEIERVGGMLDGKASAAAVAALPVPLTDTQTRAQVDAALTAYGAVVPADLAGLATGAQVTALGSPLQASAYTAPPTAAQNATAVRTELSTELGRLDVAVSTRLPTSGYTAPTAAPTAASVATAVRSELSTELGRIDAAVSTRLAATGYTAPPTVAAIRADLERSGGVLDAVPTLAEIEGSTVLAKASGVTAAQTAIVAEVNANEAKLDTLQTTANAIKTKTDTLQNTDVSGLATQASVNALGTPLQAADYIDPPTAQEIAVQVEVAIINEDDGQQVIKAIADKIKAEEVAATVIAQTVRAEIKPDLVLINNGVKKASLIIPHNSNLA